MKTNGVSSPETLGITYGVKIQLRIRMDFIVTKKLRKDLPEKYVAKKRRGGKGEYEDGEEEGSEFKYSKGLFKHYLKPSAQKLKIMFFPEFNQQFRRNYENRKSCQNLQTQYSSIYISTKKTKTKTRTKNK